MHCPVDRAVEMVTISIDGISVERCGKCNGHWLDHGELAKLAHRDASVEPVVSIARASARLCPVDATPLTEIEFPDQSNLRIDVCSTCQGIWLDAFELGQALTLLGRQPETPTSGAASRSVLDLLLRLSRDRRNT